MRIYLIPILSTGAVEAMTSLWYTGTGLQNQATPTKDEFVRMRSIPKLSSEQQTAKTEPTIRYEWPASKESQCSIIIPTKHFRENTSQLHSSVEADNHKYIAFIRSSGDVLCLLRVLLKP